MEPEFGNHIIIQGGEVKEWLPAPHKGRQEIPNPFVMPDPFVRRRRREVHNYNRREKVEEKQFENKQQWDWWNNIQCGVKQEAQKAQRSTITFVVERLRELWSCLLELFSRTAAFLQELLGELYQWFRHALKLVFATFTLFCLAGLALWCFETAAYQGWTLAIWLLTDILKRLQEGQNGPALNGQAFFLCLVASCVYTYCYYYKKTRTKKKTRTDKH